MEMDTDIALDSERNEAVPEDEAKDVSPHESVQENSFRLQERRITRAEAETTPEALKVKRSKVHAAYKKNQLTPSEQIMDVKIE